MVCLLAPLTKSWRCCPRDSGLCQSLCAEPDGSELIGNHRGLASSASLPCPSMPTHIHHHYPDQPPTSFSLSLYFFSVLFPDSHGSIPPPGDFSQCFHCSLSLPCAPADGAWRAGHMLSQTSCLPLSCPGQRRPQPEDGTGPKPTHSPAPELLSSPVQPAGAEVASCKASPRETREHPFQTDRFTLNYETASVPYPQRPAVLASPGGPVTVVGACSAQVVSTALKATLVSCSFSQKITNA